MKFKDLKKLFVMSQHDIFEIDVSVEQVVENHFFEKQSCNAHREAAINFMVEKNINFGSTANTSFVMMEKFVQVKCPKCKTKTAYEGAGGNSSRFCSNYKCPKCKTIVRIEMPIEKGMYVDFSNYKKPEKKAKKKDVQ